MIPHSQVDPNTLTLNPTGSVATLTFGSGQRFTAMRLQGWQELHLRARVPPRPLPLRAIL
jgi:hypothetical protein